MKKNTNPLSNNDQIYKMKGACTNKILKLQEKVINEEKLM